jgi:hypothetical protein
MIEREKERIDEIGPSGLGLGGRLQLRIIREVVDHDAGRLEGEPAVSVKTTGATRELAPLLVLGFKGRLHPGEEDDLGRGGERKEEALSERTVQARPQRVREDSGLAVRPEKAAEGVANRAVREDPGPASPCRRDGIMAEFMDGRTARVVGHGGELATGVRKGPGWGGEGGLEKDGLNLSGILGRGEGRGQLEGRKTEILLEDNAKAGEEALANIQRRRPRKAIGNGSA